MVAVVEENLLVSHQLPTLSISRPDLVYRPQVHRLVHHLVHHLVHRLVHHLVHRLVHHLVHHLVSSLRTCLRDSSRIHSWNGLNSPCALKPGVYIQGTLIYSAIVLQPRFKQLLTAEQSFAEDEVADQLMVATNQAAEAAATASHLLGEEVDGDMWGLDPVLQPAHAPCAIN